MNRRGFLGACVALALPAPRTVTITVTLEEALRALILGRARRVAVDSLSAQLRAIAAGPRVVCTSVGMTVTVIDCK